MNFIMLAAKAAEQQNPSMLPMLLTFGVMGIAIYFLMWRPNKKREKQEAELRSSIEVGDEVTTIGGIIGRVSSIKEDTFVIETTESRTKIRFKRSAIAVVSKLELDGQADAEPASKTEK